MRWHRKMSTVMVLGGVGFINVCAFASGNRDDILTGLSIAGIVGLETAYRHFTAKRPEPAPPELISWLDEQSRGAVQSTSAPSLSDYD